MADRSRAVAVEVCGAMQGLYTVRIHEDQQGPYRLSVTGYGTETSNTQVFNLIGSPNGHRQFRFRYVTLNGNARIEWLNESGQVMTAPQLSLVDEW